MVKECHYVKIILMNTIVISKVDKKTLWGLQKIWIVIDLVSSIIEKIFKHIL
jgi:hypothetical protein